MFLLAFSSKRKVSPRGPKIFISYRRDDVGGVAGRLHDALTKCFGHSEVFRDIDDIPGGANFVALIEQALRSCQTLVVLIGKCWVTIQDESGRRLDNTQDHVRLEIVNALKLNIPIIPVLVQGATMPRPQDLPEDLQPLAQWNAIELSETRWAYDVGQLVKRLRQLLPRRMVTWHRIGIVTLCAGALVLGAWLIYQRITTKPSTQNQNTTATNVTSSAAPLPYRPSARSPAWLITAWSQRGSSAQGTNYRQTRLYRYLQSFGRPPSSPPSNWSAAFVNWALNEAGYPGISKNDNAIWLSYGSKLLKPTEGCIVVLQRPGDKRPFHSAFFLYEQRRDIVVLGGNQLDLVSLASFSKDWVVAFRYPPSRHGR
jgi:uncharacterized protein (TIGR02594 family)